MPAQAAAQTAVITGAASGFGLEVARLAAARGMNLVLCDVQADALDRLAAEFAGAELLLQCVDVSDARAMEAMAAVARARFGAPHFVFNNAGVGCGGLVWENTVADWQWVLGANLWGMIHGVRLFTPMMLEAAAADPAYSGHIVNTASMAGLVNMPNMGVYNVSKHAVVSLSETLYQDLALVTDRIHCSVLCPFFVPTGIANSERNRRNGPGEQARPTRSQLVGQAMIEKAVAHGKVSAADVAAKVFEAVDAQQFYIYSHPEALGAAQSRAADVTQGRNPADAFQDRPEIGERLRQALR